MCKKFVVCVLLILSLSFAFAGCSSSNGNTDYQDLLDRINAAENKIAALESDIADFEKNTLTEVDVQNLLASLPQKGLQEVSTEGIVFNLVSGSNYDKFTFNTFDFDFMIATIILEPSPHGGGFAWGSKVHSFIIMRGSTEFAVKGLLPVSFEISAIAYKYL